MNSSTMDEGSTRNGWWSWTQVHWCWRMLVSCLGGPINAASGLYGEASRSVSAWDVLVASKLLVPQPACSHVDVQVLIYKEGTSGSDRYAVEFTRDSCTNLNCRIWDIHCEGWGDRLAGGEVEVRVHLKQELAPDECVVRKGVLRMLIMINCWCNSELIISQIQNCSVSLKLNVACRRFLVCTPEFTSIYIQVQIGKIRTHCTATFSSANFETHVESEWGVPACEWEELHCEVWGDHLVQEEVEVRGHPELICNINAPMVNLWLAKATGTLYS